MYRVIGFLAGIALFLALGIKHINGQVYFLICAILDLAIILFVIIFRILAAYLHGFWRIWSKRLQKWTSSALLCLSQYTELPDYQPSAIIISKDERTIAAISVSRPNFFWGLLELLICVVFSGVAPILILFMFFIYGQAIYYECQYQKSQKELSEIKEQIIVRQSAKMSLTLSLAESSLRSGENSSSPTNFIAPIYKLMEPAIVQRLEPDEEIKYHLISNQHQFSPKMKGTETIQSQFGQKNSSKNFSKASNSDVQPSMVQSMVEESKYEADSSFHEGLTGSLPKYKQKHPVQLTQGALESDIKNKDL